MAQVLQRLTPAEQEELAPLRRSIEMWMGHTDPADHVRFQQLLKRYFTPAMVDRLRPGVRAFTHELLDAVAPEGRLDVLRDLAYPLPANVIAQLLGMPAGDREQLQAWSRDIVPIFGNGDVQQLRQAQHSMIEMHDYLRVIAAERRREPREDVLSMFMAAKAQGAVTEDEAVANCVLLLFAGHETTANLIANGLVLLFEHPEQLAQLRAKPYRFDITRPRNRHLSFGMGTYYCLGAALARMETDECLRILLERCPDLRPAYETPGWLPTPPFGHRLGSLPVEF